MVLVCQHKPGRESCYRFEWFSFWYWRQLFHHIYEWDEGKWRLPPPLRWWWWRWWWSLSVYVQLIEFVSRWTISRACFQKFHHYCLHRWQKQWNFQKWGNLRPNPWRRWVKDLSLGTVHYLSDGGGGGGGGLGEKFQKSPFSSPPPSIKLKKIRTPLFYWGIISIPLSQLPNYNIRFNIITKFRIVLNKHISPWTFHSSTACGGY